MKRDTGKQAIIAYLKRTPIIEAACKHAGVARSSHYRWMKEDPEFAKAVEEALTEGSRLINDLAESQLLAAIRDRNLGAIIFWLKHHHQSYATKVELTGRIMHERKELTEEEKLLVEKALRLALPREPLQTNTEDTKENE